MTNAFVSVKVNLPFPAVATPKRAITLWESQSGILKKAPAYSTTPTVQAAVTDCDAAAQALDGTLTEIEQLRAQLQNLEKTRDVQFGTLHRKHDAVETGCNTASNNDPVAAKAWTGTTTQRTTIPLIPAGTGAPLNSALNNIKRHAGSVKGRCDKEAGAIGYLFQYGTTDPAHPEAWAPATQLRGHTFTLRNLPIGQVLYMRIAIMRRGNVQGAWSAIQQVTVR